MKTPIYLDYHATTPIDPRVLEAMMPFLTTEFGNAASSAHIFGTKARDAVEAARGQIAGLIGANTKEIFFTSGATESINIALKGAMEAYDSRGDHLVTQVTEHKAVLDVCKALEKQGKKITYLPVDENGQIRLKDLEAALTDRTVLVCLMHANNEIGTLQPITEAGKITRKRGILFHVDAAQTAGKIPLNVNESSIDLLSFSAHKMYGPKGAGALYVRHQNPHVKVSPQIHGGGHEGGVRSGTLNVPAIVGFGAACRICQQEMAQDESRIRKLRDRLQKGLTEQLDQVYVNGHPTERLYNNLNLSFSCTESASLIMSIGDRIAISSGSACSSGSVEMSHVLKALGIPGERIHSAVRFGLGRFTTDGEIDGAVQYLVETVKRLRSMSPLYEPKAQKPKSV